MNLLLYGLVALAIMASIGTGVHFVKQWGGNEVRAEWKQANARAETAARQKESADRQSKEKADAENVATVARLNAGIAKLRNERDRRAPNVPAAPATSSRPDLACFDRAEYQRAYGDLVTEVRGFADEGTTRTLELDNAKRWGVGRAVGEVPRP